MSDDLEQVMAAMRAAGWRSSEDRLKTTAVRRLKSARHHRERAAANRDDARLFADRFPEMSRHCLELGLRHEARAAERCGSITRAVRDVALKLAPTWTGDADELLRTAEAIELTS